MTSRAAAALLAGATLGLMALLGGCGDDSGPAARSEATPPPGETTAIPPEDLQPLPPNDVVAVAAVYDPMLEPFGLRVTRGALIDRSGGGYEASDTGTHLALYVEPTREWSTDDYLAGAWDVAALLTPDVFARYGDLESYDICLEPMPADDDRPEPLPVTQLDITREVAAEIDWDGGSLVDLVTAGLRGQLILNINDDLQAHPGYLEAVDVATKAVNSTTTAALPAPG